MQVALRHPRSIPISVRRSYLGEGDEAIRKTVSLMASIIRDQAADWNVRTKATQAIAHVPERDQLGEMEAVFDWVTQNTRYTKDPFRVELLQEPRVALQQIEGGQKATLDCDDMTMLGLSMAKSIGYPVGMRVVSTRPDQRFNHVYGLVSVYGQWVPFDAVRKDRPLGWETKFSRKMDYFVK